MAPCLHVVRPQRNIFFKMHGRLSVFIQILGSNSSSKFRLHQCRIHRQGNLERGERRRRPLLLKFKLAQLIGRNCLFGSRREAS